MNKREAKIMALRGNGKWLLACDTLPDMEDLPHKDAAKVSAAQRELALEMIARADRLEKAS